MLKAEKNFSLMVFGASGHLAQLKIFPSIYEMALESRLDVNYCVFGFARSSMSQEEFRESFKISVEKAFDVVDYKILNKILEKVHYFAGNYTDNGSYADFKAFVENFEMKGEEYLRLAYFSVPPTVFEPILNGLKENFNVENKSLRLILEKPFGDNYETANELKILLETYFLPSQIYLLDHYLGKEGLFNLLSLRYANSIFSNLLQGKYIANIQISALEQVGLEGRAGYFDSVGSFKDMIQSHLFQIVGFLTMNIPRKFNVDLVHNSKMQALQNLFYEKGKDNLIKAQYEDYIKEEGVAKNSETPTYSAVKVGLDLPGWRDVPIYLRSGKCLKQKWTGVVIEFKPHENQLNNNIETVNRLLIEIQPNEKIEFYLYTKKGGEDLGFVPMTTGKPIYCSGDCLSEHARLLLDVVAGNQLLFLSFEEILASWKITDKILKCEEGCDLNKYESGVYGPAEADELLKKDGFYWFNNF